MEPEFLCKVLLQYVANLKVSVVLYIMFCTSFHYYSNNVMLLWIPDLLYSKVSFKFQLVSMESAWPSCVP